MKQNRLMYLAAAALLCFGVVGCNQPASPQRPADQAINFKDLEDARGTARENAMWNAQHWRQGNPLYSDYDILGRGDSSQTNECPQGDGWATMDFVPRTAGNRLVKVKCSTVSPNLACLEENDFKSKAYASEDGHCQPTIKVPYPLPKIGQ